MNAQVKTAIDAMTAAIAACKAVLPADMWQYVSYSGTREQYQLAQIIFGMEYGRELLRDGAIELPNESIEKS